MNIKQFLPIVVLLCSPALAAAADPTSKSPAGARVYLIEPANGATVPTTFEVKFGLRGMGVAPAGADVKNTGHHHLLIDVAELPDMTKPLPATKQVKHFGGGQTETTLTLEPGVHTLQMLLANYAHIPHDAAVLSKKITITVH